MEDSSQQHIEVKNIVVKTLPKKVLVLSMVMVALIIIAVGAYLISFYQKKPSVNVKQGAESVLTVDQTEDPCAEIDKQENQSGCLDGISYKLDLTADMVNSL